MIFCNNIYELEGGLNIFTGFSLVLKVYFVKNLDSILCEINQQQYEY